MAHLVVVDDIAITAPRLTGRVVQAVSQRHGAIDKAHGIVEAHEPFNDIYDSKEATELPMQRSAVADESPVCNETYHAGPYVSGAAVFLA